MEGGDLPVTGVADEGRGSVPPRGEFIDQLQRHHPFRAVPLHIREPGLGSAGLDRFGRADRADGCRFGFVFLVALGIDYNIFLMRRVREKSKWQGTREGILHGLASTGGVITYAGPALAATFAALGVLPLLFLAQISFIVAFGVLLGTFLVRSLLVPALSHDVGRRIWWPSGLGRSDR